MLPGVFRFAWVEDSLEVRLWAVAAWMGSDGYLSGPMAAYWLGLQGVPHPERITIVTTRSARPPGWLVETRKRSGRLPEIKRVDGLPLSPVEQVLLECAAQLSRSRTGAIVDDALRRGLTDLAKLHAFLGSLGAGCRGKSVLARVVAARDDRDARVRSLFETKMLRILRSIPGLGFVADHSVTVGGERYVLDFYIPGAALAIECHSFQWHMGRHDRDARRDRAIKSLGIETPVLHVERCEPGPGRGEARDRIRGPAPRRTISALMFLRATS